MTATRVSEQEYAERRARVAAACTETGLDGVLVAGRSSGTLDNVRNVRWLTGHTTPGVVTTPTGPWAALGQDFVVVDSDGVGTLVAAGAAEPPHASVIRLGVDVEGLLVESIREMGLSASRLGLAGTEVLPWATLKRLESEFPGLSLVSADRLLAKLRLTLSETECAMLRQAARIGTTILREALTAAVPGATDGDVVAAGLARAARSERTQHWDFVLASGPASLRYAVTSGPHWDPTTPYRAGDLVHPDCFGYVDGYVYDVQRTIVVGGDATPEQQWLIDGVWEHVQRLGNALYDGITPADVHTRGLEIMRELGHVPPDDDPRSWFGAFSHFGHAFSTGFDWPWLASTVPEADFSMQAPFAVTIEIPWEDPLVGAAFLEDEFLVLPDRVEWLTRDLEKSPCS